MQLYSTNNRSITASLKEAVLKGLPEDNGLYMPFNIPQLDSSFIKNLDKYSFQEIAVQITTALFEGAIPHKKIIEIIENSITFPAPLVKLDEHKYILELFHGPSLAFKDFGARFMAQLMAYFNKDEDSDLVILVATSGDTGGAVASGFYKTPGIKVVILYPSGRVSHLQEQQLTTLGENISALEVQGTFDDCQALVKKAFLDKDLNREIRLSSANSINIARLIPQSFYYFEAYKQLEKGKESVVFCVPCGNFGNLTAGMLAQKMGLPIKHFIAATNINDVVPAYLKTGNFLPRNSTPTISNAMDVGNPSNFARMLDLFSTINSSTAQTVKGSTWNIIQEKVSGYAYNDKETKRAIKEVYSKYGYIIDPHGAVGYLALREFQKKTQNTKGIILETAHPSKFINVVEEVIKKEVAIPSRLAELSNKDKDSTIINTDYTSLKSFLVENY